MSNLKEKAKLNRKKLLSAAVIAVCGIAGLGYACMTNSPKENITIADKGKYISSDTGSREITNEMYDFNKVSSHKIIQSAVSLEESDSVKSLGNNMYMVPSDYTDENITETYSDDVITVSGNAADTEIKNEYDSQESALKKYLDGENTTGNDLRVAVIDSGISGYGTDNRILKGANFSATGGDDFSDDNGHGNVMAGIISEMTADNVNLMPVKVIDSSGRGTVASLYKGIEYAVEQNVDVINLSVTTASSDNGLIKKAVKDAVNAGITVVAAAGNYGTNADYYSPANISEVITVSSVDNDLNPSEFTNYGSCIDYAAIGETEKASGTSVSAAKVTGIVSLLKGVDKSYSTNDIETILDKYAVNTGKNSQYTGRGILALENVNTNKVEEKKIEDKKEQYEPLIEKIKRETKKKYKNWNELSADDLNELIKNDTEDHIAYFWQGLNDAEKVDVLKKSHYLNQDISVFDSETNESAEMSYAKHLENDFNFKDEVYTSNWRDFKLWDSNSGFYYLRYTGDATGYYRVSITIDSNSAHTGRYHLSVAFHSGTDIYNSFKINNPEGTTVTRASVHNVSIVKKLRLRVGDKISVFKANKIIPCIDKNLTPGDELTYAESHACTCPVCGMETSPMITHSGDRDVEVEMCTNPNCAVKQIKKFVHFCERDCMNIVGLSEKTLEKFIEKGFIKQLADLYRLDTFERDIAAMDGFGQKSYDNIWKSIQRSRKTTFVSFIHALGIPMVGKGQAKLFDKAYKGDVRKFFNDVYNRKCFTGIDGIGEKIELSLWDWGSRYLGWIPFEKNLLDEMWRISNNAEVYDLLRWIDVEIPAEANVAGKDILSGKTFVITGSVNHFKNRAELQAKIEELGGKATGSVTKKTSYLINNDVESTSGKNKKAKELGVPIISEDEFLEMIGE